MARSFIAHMEKAMATEGMVHDLWLVPWSKRSGHWMHNAEIGLREGNVYTIFCLSRESVREQKLLDRWEEEFASQREGGSNCLIAVNLDSDPTGARMPRFLEGVATQAFDGSASAANKIVQKLKDLQRESRFRRTYSAEGEGKGK